MSHEHHHGGNGAERFSRDHDPAHTDSAGNSWEGRAFHDNPFAKDDGTTPPAVAAALDAFHDNTGTLADVVAALHGTRLLIPLVAHAGDDFDVNAPIMEDKVQELAVVTVAGQNGDPIIPAFTSAEAMKAWNPEARPIPMDAQRVALAAASEGVDRIVLNAGTPQQLVFRRPIVWALAQGYAWIPGWESTELHEHLTKAISKVKGAVRIALAAADPMSTGNGAELRIVLHLVAGLDQASLTRVVTQLNEILSTSGTLQMAADSVEVKLAVA